MNEILTEEQMRKLYKKHEGIFTQDIRKCGENFLIAALKESKTIKRKENKVTDKIQFESEEDAIKFFKKAVNIHTYDAFEKYKDINMRILHREGYIKKSPLQQKVEEAEEMYSQWLKNEFDGINLIHRQKDLIQLFKEKHPEDFK